MQFFAAERSDWLANHLSAPGIRPSHDTFNRIFQIIDPKHHKQGLTYPFKN